MNKKTLNNLYCDYAIKYNGKQKHNYSHFILVMSALNFHHEIIRPQIKWWHDLKKEKKYGS